MMAYISKCGSKFCVYQGNNGRKLSEHSSKKDADDKLKKLHKKNNPMSANRGSSARKRYSK